MADGLPLPQILNVVPSTAKGISVTILRLSDYHSALPGFATPRPPTGAEPPPRRPCGALFLMGLLGLPLILRLRASCATQKRFGFALSLIVGLICGAMAVVMLPLQLALMLAAAPGGASMLPSR